MPAKRISEAKTRKDMIDPQLEKAARYLRDHSKVKIEIPKMVSKSIIGSSDPR